jgi:hypothetical protein
MVDMAKVKRTYNLSERTVRSVRELSERYGVARSQDGVVELAVDELERRLRDAEETRAWAAAREDPEFQREATDLEGAYRAADAETWPA